MVEKILSQITCLIEIQNKTNAALNAAGKILVDRLDYFFIGKINIWLYLEPAIHKRIIKVL